jgi:hypothetical protein
MPPLTEARDTVKRSGSLYNYPVKANVKGFQGGIAVMSGGFLAPASTALNLVAVGIFPVTVDNIGGVDGAISADVEPGIFQFDNSAAGDAITLAHVGADCFLVDDQTVARTNGGNTRSVAGKIVAVNAAGVWVKIGV